jgi:hypothetical protein
MDSKHSGSLRIARRIVAPALETVHERLCEAFGVTFAGDPLANGAVYVFPGSDDPVESFAVPYLFEEVFSKYEGAEDPNAVTRTWVGFWEAESCCAETNIRLNRWSFGPYARELSRMRNWIGRVLGPFNMDEAALNFDFGPGATTRLPRRKASSVQKYTGKPDATNENAAFGEGVINLTPPWALAQANDNLTGVNIVRGNRVTTVPKNRKKRRIIAIEPDLNMYVQKGIGKMIRRRLKKVGIDLDDQTLNQALAKQGSMNGILATIDLSMASDTISESLVELLLPPDWLAALGMCRSRIGVLPPEAGHESVLYRKFSSMGNGYTFELESLIFASVLYAICPSDLKERQATVYGDDIIAPCSVVLEIKSLFDYIGFSMNSKKTHTSGEFRESCGKHFYGGHDVTPFYVKKYDRKLLSLFKLHNQIWRLQNRWTWLGSEKRRRLLAVCAWLRSHAPSSWREQLIVDGLGDGAFVGYLFDEVTPRLRSRSKGQHTWDRSYYFRSFVTIPSVRSSDLPSGAIAASLRGLDRNPTRAMPSDQLSKHVAEPSFGIATGERLAVKELRIRAYDCHRQWREGVAL